MDENTPNTSPPNSKSTSIQHVDSCLPSAPNELKAKNLDSEASSPRRPLSDTTMPSTNTSQSKPTATKSASFNKQPSHSNSPVDHKVHSSSPPKSPQPEQKQRHRDQLSLSDIYNDHNDDTGLGKHLRNSQRTSPTASRMVAAIGAATAAAAARTDGVDDLKTQVADLGAALKAERETSAWMAALEQDVQRFKDIRDDVIDSVDILAEFNQVSLAFDHEKKQQAEVDHLMNCVAERLFEVEHARQHLVK